MSDTAPVPPPKPPRIGPNAVKLIAVGAMLLLLLVPHWMIAGLIEEREQRRDGVVQEIAQSWGRGQVLAGPLLRLPYRVAVVEKPGEPPVWRRGTLMVPPTDLRAEVALAPETRRRGLFEATVYTAAIDLSGSFNLAGLTPPRTGDPAAAGTGPVPLPAAEFLWPEAQLVLGSNDLRLAAAETPLRWGDRTLPLAEGGIDPTQDREPCIAAETLRWSPGLQAAPEGASPFALRLELRGTGSFHMLPLARRLRLGISGNWATSSFTGRELPASSQVTAEGFAAGWTTTTRQPLSRGSLCAGAAGEGIGVELLEAVPTYRMVNRASKYIVFFLALAFITYGIFEVVARVRIHPLQYGLLGASVVLFPLLLLALGEPLGFAPAYGIAAALVAGQASLFTAATTASARLGGILAAVCAALFGFLYVVLSLEAFALLAGALALFAALSLVMAVSRRVEWGMR
ncbi:cell envelope integrity protein CreD [Falsiroseomonas tokyonensis]|uniref:Cell envelope integrity protein CreD n=1 Tax=Falsiroseomonas tokyonensis TaxID=430521 RepID=A0ABV7BZC2_9PROT|nr:cell envelope integrity protein CreD [Falsiroseomonas tokyonensis]MBU8540994.1 inner membrane CreD family protein [Falsiroseomonas tokyonensis]